MLALSVCVVLMCITFCDSMFALGVGIGIGGVATMALLAPSTLSASPIVLTATATIPMGAVIVGANNETDFSCWKQVIRSNSTERGGILLTHLESKVPYAVRDYSGGRFQYAILTSDVKETFVVKPVAQVGGTLVAHTWKM